MRHRAMTLTLLLIPMQLLAGADDYGPGARYASSAYAYESEPPPGLWVPWSALEDDYARADSGYLGVSGYGAVVMPVCWQGEAPSQLALLEVFMSRFGEDYPTPFIHTEADVDKDDATGRHLVGSEAVDDARSFRAARTEPAKASWISTTSMSLACRPARSRATGVEKAGPSSSSSRESLPE